jgi:hypothetical protein
MALKVIFWPILYFSKMNNFSFFKYSNSSLKFWGLIFSVLNLNSKLLKSNFDVTNQAYFKPDKSKSNNTKVAYCCNKTKNNCLENDASWYGVIWLSMEELTLKMQTVVATFNTLYQFSLYNQFCWTLDIYDSLISI